MNETNLRNTLAQASEHEAVELLQQTLRQSVWMALYDAMEQEVNLLCGAKHKPSESEYKRAGSEQGSVYLDGEKEPVKRLKKAVKKHWPNAIQQECLIHMQRHTRDKLRTRDRAEFDRYNSRLRDAEGREAGDEAFEDLMDFLSERNAAAALALRSRKEDLTAFHQLDLPSTLNVTFLTEVASLSLPVKTCLY